MPAGQRTVSDQVICVAFQRGVQPVQLARSAGISVQRVHQLLKRQGITVGRHNHPRRTGRVARPCQGCGQIEWVVPSEIDRRKYCSPECRAKAAKARGKTQRRIPDADASKAIELRNAGWTWKRIEDELGYSYQSVQRRVWQLLDERGELTEANVEPLLRDVRGRKHDARWGWLEQATGLRPQAGSAVPLPGPALSINLNESDASGLQLFI